MGTLRMGSSKAITAVAHKLARVIYATLTGHAKHVRAKHGSQDERLLSSAHGLRTHGLSRLAVIRGARSADTFQR